MKVLILFGGESSEHEVSIASASNINQTIDRDKHEVSLLFISKDGRFYAANEVRDYDSTDALIEVAPLLGQGKFIALDGALDIAPDVVFPAMHGENSEDGSIPALCQLLHVPVVGCDMYASSLCMDKLAAKEILEYIGIRTAPFRIHNANQPIGYEEAVAALGSPLFIKPTKAGSSVGISKVHSEAEWQPSLDLAHQYDDTVLIETAVPGVREIEVAILGNADARAATPGEIVPDREFYDYDSKYDDASTSEVIIPAKLPAAVMKQIRETAVAAYHALGCSGLARVDFLYGDDDSIILSEINTMPGFTDISMYTKLWAHEGLTQTELINRLIELAR
jgi:D-alanine-D-alanine ligase